MIMAKGSKLNGKATIYAAFALVTMVAAPSIKSQPTDFDLRMWHQCRVAAKNDPVLKAQCEEQLAIANSASDAARTMALERRIATAKGGTAYTKARIEEMKAESAERREESAERRKEMARRKQAMAIARGNYERNEINARNYQESRQREIESIATLRAAQARGYEITRQSLSGTLSISGTSRKKSSKKNLLEPLNCGPGGRGFKGSKEWAC